jgi:hypothetical protein
MMIGLRIKDNFKLTKKSGKRKLGACCDVVRMRGRY